MNIFKRLFKALFGQKSQLNETNSEEKYLSTKNQENLRIKKVEKGKSGGEIYSFSGPLASAEAFCETLHAYGIHSNNPDKTLKKPFVQDGVAKVTMSKEQAKKFHKVMAHKDKKVLFPIDCLKQQSKNYITELGESFGGQSQDHEGDLRFAFKTEDAATKFYNKFCKELTYELGRNPNPLIVDVRSSAIIDFGTWILDTRNRSGNSQEGEKPNDALKSEPQKAPEDAKDINKPARSPHKRGRSPFAAHRLVPNTASIEK